MQREPVPYTGPYGPAQVTRFGVIDLGSNTARLVVYDFQPHRGYWRVDEIREQTRLGQGLARTGALDEGGMERALAALRLYRAYADATGLENVRVLATSAARDATNADVFLERLREAGFTFDVLAGVEEARLGLLAVANSFPFDDAWVMDLGGGSAQISLMRDRRWVEGDAYPLGAVRLTEAYLDGDPPGEDEIDALEAGVEEELAELARRIRDSGLPLVAMGGTVRNLAKAVRKRDGYQLPVLHGYVLGREDLGELTERMAGKTARQRGKISGISSDRGDIILAGALVYRYLAGAAGLDGIHISGYGLREGALFQQICPEEPHIVPDVRRFAVDNLTWRYPQPCRHVQHVGQLAMQLFEGLRPLHGYGDWEAELLRAGARLHDIGTAVNYNDHHKHGAYLLNSTALRGYSHREQALLTLLVRYHRRGNPKTAPYGPLMDDGDKQRVRVLATCLRMAEHMETSRARRVRGVRVDLGNGEDDAVRIELEADSEEAWAEFWETQKQADLFRKAFGRELDLTFA